MQRNIITHLPGVISVAKNAKTPYDAQTIKRRIFMKNHAKNLTNRIIQRGNTIHILRSFRQKIFT